MASDDRGGSMSGDETLTPEWTRAWLREASADFDRDEFMDHIDLVIAAECSEAARQAAEEALATAADEFEIPTPTRYGVRKWLRDRAARIARAGGEER